MKYINQLSCNNRLLRNSMLGAVLVSCVTPALAESIAERAETNRKIVSCYAISAQQAYADRDKLKNICTASASHEGVFVPLHAGRDTRNGMDHWVPSYTQPAGYEDVLKFYERHTANRKEVLLAFRGSSSIGDWAQDVRAQVFQAHVMSPTAIGSITQPPGGSSSPRANAGFYARVENLAPVINAKLQQLDDWLAADPTNRSIGVKLSGHSLGAAAASIASYYVANRYLNNIKADVELFAFNSPVIANTDLAKDINQRASTCHYNVHIFNNHWDIVSKIPRPGQAIELLSESHDPANQFADPDCKYVKGLRVNHPVLSFNPFVYHESTQWFYDNDIQGYNTQSYMTDEQMVAMFPERPIGTQQFQSLPWTPNFVDFVNSHIFTGIDSIPSDSQVRHLRTDLKDMELEDPRWQHSVFISQGEKTSDRIIYNGDYTLDMYNGRLELRGNNGVDIWNSGTITHNAELRMQADGNLTIYAGNTRIWQSNTAGSGAEYLTLTDDGFMVLMDENGVIVKQFDNFNGNCNGCPNDTGVSDDGF